MSVFKDTDGREWRIRLTAPILQKVEEATKIKLATSSGEGAVAATADGEILTRVLWLLCGHQELEGKKLTTDQFAEAVASGDVFEAAGNALQEAVVDFTPPAQRPMLKAVLKTERAEQAARAEIVIEKLNGDELHDQVCHAFRVGLDNQLGQILTRLESVGGSLASPDLTLTPPPSENSVGQKLESGEDRSSNE